MCVSASAVSSHRQLIVPHPLPWHHAQWVSQEAPVAWQCQSQMAPPASTPAPFLMAFITPFSSCAVLATAFLELLRAVSRLSPYTSQPLDSRPAFKRGILCRLATTCIHHASNMQRHSLNCASHSCTQAHRGWVGGIWVVHSTRFGTPSR